MMYGLNAHFHQVSGAMTGFVPCFSSTGGHMMAYHEWGDPNNPKVLICVHGVSRCAHDFVPLARVLSKHYRVICPDVVGRGFSSWLLDPTGYQLGQYVADMSSMLMFLGLKKVDWVGTSMGGLIGMMMAQLPSQPIRRLLLNDVGTSLEPEALSRISSYLGVKTNFDSFQDGIHYLKTVSQPFGQHSEAEWKMLCEPLLRPLTDDLNGSWRVHYDPQIALGFLQMQPAFLDTLALTLWNVWDQISVPTLIVRGAESDLLSHQTVKEMCERHAGASFVEIAGVGHAPTFFHLDQIKLVQSFLGIFS
jgi:pimeloyl-ACP methyl ester carboxylesterase